MIGAITYSILKVYLERTDRPYYCPKCNRKFAFAKSKNETKSIRSLSVHGHLLELVFPRIRINCKDCKFPYEPLPDTILPDRRVTKIYAQWIYEKCKVMTYSDLSKETGLSDSNLRSIEKELLTEKIKNREITEIKTIGIDEIQSGHGHQYSHIVTDLGNEEVLFVGDGRKSVDLAPFLLKYRRFLPKVEFVVMDMWQGFIKVFRRFTPDAKIIHDQFHIAKHLNEALNEVRIEEYKKIATDDRKYIKGKKWLLLSRRSNLSLLGRNSLRELFRINKRIMKAYLLKEQFRKIWGYESKAWALKFWLNWKSSLRWQRLAPLVKFADLFDAHLDGIMNFYDHKGTLKMGYIEGFNNKVKTLIRRHYGFRDKEFLKLKIIQIGSASLKDYVPYPWFSTE